MNNNKFVLKGYQKTEASAFLYWDKVKDAVEYSVYDGDKKLNSRPVYENSFLYENPRTGVIHRYKVTARKADGKIIESSVKNLAAFRKIKNPGLSNNYDLKIPVSKFAAGLEFIGAAVDDPRYHYWCTSAIIDDSGKTHLFTSRVPCDENVPFEKGWKINCEIAHFIADSPEGPFKEIETVFSNDNLPEDRMWSAHNSKIRKIDGTYCLLFIVQTSSSVETQKTVLATSKSLYGPWEMHGENGFILDSDKRIVNPDLIKFNGKYILYYKTLGRDNKTAFYTAVSDKIEGPYKVNRKPVVEGMTVEDLNVFSFNNKIYMLSTDNFGESGCVGAGLIWQSDNGLEFDRKDTELGFFRMSDYAELPPGRKLNYGSTPDKHERPDVLMINGKPAYLYVAGGTSIDGTDACQNYIYKINI